MIKTCFSGYYVQYIALQGKIPTVQMGEWIIDAALGKESECEHICESTSLPTTGALVIHVDNPIYVPSTYPHLCYIPKCGSLMHALLQSSLL